MNKAAKKKTKSTPKPIKNRNYFARACRFLARILLFASIISCVGIATLLIMKHIQPAAPATTSTPAPAAAPATPYYPVSKDRSVAIAFSIIINFIIIVCAIVGFIYLAYKYNSYARSFIDWVARKAKLPIHFVELGLPMIFWSATIIMLIPIYPAVTLPLIFAFIANEFLFILAWLAYGSPNYVY